MASIAHCIVQSSDKEYLAGRSLASAMAHERVCSCREHHQFLEEVRAHVLHNGPKPGGQMLGRATLASRSSTDLAAQDEAAPSAASVTGREESASSTGAASAADAADAKGVQFSSALQRPCFARNSHVLQGVAAPPYCERFEKGLQSVHQLILGPAQAQAPHELPEAACPERCARSCDDGMGASHERGHGCAGAEEPGRARREGALAGAVSELEPEWMMLAWPRPMHFEHTAVDDHPGLSASRTKLSVRLAGAWRCLAIICKLCGRALESCKALEGPGLV